MLIGIIYRNNYIDRALNDIHMGSKVMTSVLIATMLSKLIPL